MRRKNDISMLQDAQNLSKYFQIAGKQTECNEINFCLTLSNNQNDVFAKIKRIIEPICIVRDAIN